ncbi:MAG: amidohydrolase family protein [Xanthobacteraceae bacterium]|jgi:aminocarboxymuconate-semialdehyde decarboxylase|uniref:amidohydrolase family protein n=1 Tax=Pseudolabrys sp. TaxID=1960880 RepID=UPI003D139C15
MTIWNKYANTAARTHGKPGRDRRPKSVTIDMHAHAAFPAVGQFVGNRLDLTTVPLAHFASQETKDVNAKQDVDIKERITGYDGRFTLMDEMGVDMQFVMPAPPQLYHTVALDVAVPAARMVNDHMAEFCARHKDRLIPCGTVPMQDGNEAAKELEYVVNKLGFKGVEILTNVDGRELSDPAFAPFWKKAEELDVLVAIHPNGFTEGRRLSRFYFSNVVGNPFETTLALHYLIFDGVFERHPKLKVFAMHGGGYLGGYSGRIDHAWGARSDVNVGLPKPPGSYLRTNVFFDTVVFTPLQLEMLVRTFGADRVLLGTDYPFDMLEYDPIGHVADVEALDDGTRAAIDGLNAKKLLGL